MRLGEAERQRRERERETGYTDKKKVEKRERGYDCSCAGVSDGQSRRAVVVLRPSGFSFMKLAEAGSKRGE